jgi:hypothetical protein
MISDSYFGDVLEVDQIRHQQKGKEVGSRALDFFIREDDLGQ